MFDDDLLGIDGRSLDSVCRNPEDPHRVSDELLRWHFRQSVFANMNEIYKEPSGKERFELELSARLHGVG